jgi:hypothetical protein
MADFEVLKEFRSKPVMKLRDKETGDEYFIKLASANEVETSIKAPFMQREGGILTVPKARELPTDDVPEAIRKTLAEKLAITGHKADRYLLTDALPCEVTVGSLDINKRDGMKALGGKPITSKEWESMMDAMRSLNQNGVENWDIASNLFVKRDKEGELKFYLIDFGNDGLSRSNPDAMFEDIGQLRKLQKDLIDAGMVAKPEPEKEKPAVHVIPKAKSFKRMEYIKDGLENGAPTMKWER